MSVRVAIVVAAASALALMTAPADAQPRRTPTAIVVEPRLDSIAQALFALDLAPGMSVVVVRDTQVVLAKGYGFADVEAKRPVTAQTVFYIASTTKSFTGLATAVLASRGTLQLDAPLSRYLPGVKLQSPLNPDSITLRMLLTHTHGISNDGPVVMRTAYSGEFTTPQLVSLLAEHPAERTGREYRYGNIGYNVLSLALDAVAKSSWKDLLQRELFVPLGMSSTSAYVSRAPAERLAMPYRAEPNGFVRVPYGKTDGNMHAAGGLVTTALDMGRWLEAHINNGRLDGRQVLSAAPFAEAHRLQATTRANQRGWQVQGYGFGWQIATNGNDTVLVHGGGFLGFATHMSFMPARRVGVVVMANEVNLGGALADLVAQQIYRALNGQVVMTADSTAAFRQLAQRQRESIAADRARRAARPQTLPFPLSAYAGTYENPGYGRLELTLVNGALEARYGAAWSKVEVYDNTQNQLRVDLTGTGTVVRVQMAGNRAESLTMDSQTYRRVPD